MSECIWAYLAGVPTGMVLLFAILALLPDPPER